MTLDAIIRMAREAELVVIDGIVHGIRWYQGVCGFNLSELERFAALAIAAEREACAKVCEVERKVNAAEELREALQNVLHHPHIQAYLPYAPQDKVMRAAFQAIDRAEGITE